MKVLMVVAAGVLLVVALLIAVVAAPLAIIANVAADGFSSATTVCVTGSPTPTSDSPAAAATATAPSEESPAATTVARLPQTPSATPTSVGEPCVNPNANAVVSWALLMAQHLFVCPNRYKPGLRPMAQCWDSGFPDVAITLWQRMCPNCSQWQDGNLQCVMYNAAAFGLAGIPLWFGPSGAANAVGFWSNYAHRPGWIEIPSAVASTANRGLPAAGDMMVWYETFAPTVGHIAIVLAVDPPHDGRSGTVVFGNANNFAPIVTETINPDLSVDTWSGGMVLGYIRYVGTTTP